jgi:glycosyltransferase involved in cell wall biosynthesis
VHEELCDKLAALAHQIHVHSYSAAAELVRDRRLDQTKLAVIPHGNYAPIFRRRRVPPRAAQDNRRFLLFGRLGRYKGSQELVRAFLELPHSRAELMIAGKQVDPIDLSGVPPSVAARITMENRFLDEAEIPDLLASVDFVVAPYLASLTSGTLMLAMSAGRPVIAPRLPTLAELITDGQNGVLFDPQEENGLAAALARACDIEASKLHRMGEAAFNTAMSYDWRLIGNLWSGVLHRLVAGTPVRRINLARTILGELTPVPGIR